MFMKGNVSIAVIAVMAVAIIAVGAFYFVDITPSKEELKRFSGTRFDSKVVDAFLELLEESSPSESLSVEMVINKIS